MFREFFILAIITMIIVNSTGDNTESSTKSSMESTTEAVRICGRNEIYTENMAEVACQSVCSKQKPDDCPHLNVSGCICLDGYKRRTPASVCILASDCPAKDQDPVVLSDDSEDSDDPRDQDQDDQDDQDSSDNSE
ncbi:hypothetical protein HCN44_001273 [Aphidius gifuensis]|uniref:Venom protein n=1 Tax=Aphidius gifuensis TaxID=684658 RepID=A0A835CQ18_APHGI|nr:uncharacterized protein LOC122857001 [Aphidius gifuensis]KAF7988700.1 hypothetical protein HCN44_001273 [Aphidius gifuensis]